MVILGTVAAFGLGTAMVLSSISASSGVTRDTNTKSAFGVAEAGVSNALFRYNRFDTSTLPCLNEGAGGQVVLEAAQTEGSNNGWCRPVTANAANGAYSYSVRPFVDGSPSDGDEMIIVSTGYDDGVSRRIKVSAQYTTQPGNGGVTPFEDFQLLADSITIANGSTITADIGTQGGLIITNGGKLHCEKVQAGSTDFPKDDPCPVGTPDFDLPPVDNTIVKATNDNGLLSTGGCQAWDATTKRLTLNCAYTLGTAGVTQNYYLCKLTLNSSAELLIAPGAIVNVWFAPPEDCGGETVPYVGANGSKIRTDGSPAATLAFLVSDSPTRTSMALTAGGNGVWPGCSDNFIIYAPTTDISMTTAAHLCAGIAANTLTTGPGSTITKTSMSTVWELPGSTGGPVPHYVTSEFLECAPASSSTAPPDAGC